MWTEVCLDSQALSLPSLPPPELREMEPRPFPGTAENKSQQTSTFVPQCA